MILPAAGPALALALLAISTPKPIYGPGPAFNPGPIADSAYSFAFDLPGGLRAEHAPDISEYWIGPVPAGISIYVSVEAHPWVLPKTKSDPHQYLLAYARDNLAMRCDYDGESASGSADSLISPRSFQTKSGLPAVEYLMRVREEFYGYGDDYKGEDSTAVIISTAKSWPTESDSVSYSQVERIAGPEFLVDVGRPGHPAVVRVEFNCDRRPDSATLRLGRAIVHSIRLIGSQ